MCCWLLLYSTILHAWADSLHSCMPFWMSDCSFFIAHFWISTEVVHLQCCLVVTWQVPCEAAAVLVHVLCTPYTSLQCHFIPSDICRVHVCLGVTCHLHLAKCSESFTHYCSNTGVEWIPKWEPAQKVEPGEETSPTVPQPRDLSIMSPTL